MGVRTNGLREGSVYAFCFFVCFSLFIVCLAPSPLLLPPPSTRSQCGSEISTDRLESGYFHMHSSGDGPAESYAKKKEETNSLISAMVLNLSLSKFVSRLFFIIKWLYFIKRTQI